MILSHNPDSGEFAVIISRSEQKAAKWIKDTETGDVWAWPAEQAFHAKMAEILHVEKYDKGIAVND